MGRYVDPQTALNRQQAIVLLTQGLTYAAVAFRMSISRQRVQQITRPNPEVRDEVRVRANDACQKCGTAIPKGNGHVHHVKVAGLTIEQFDATENLAYLCRPCHRAAHRNQGRPATSWTVRNVGMEYQRMAKAAAAAQGLPVGEWVENVIGEAAKQFKLPVGEVKP
jgi:hypothetical protein